MVQAKFGSVMSVLLLTLVLSLSGCAADVSKAPVKTVDAFFVVDDIQEAREDIETSGGRVVHIFPEEGVMIGEVSKGFKSKHVSAVYYAGTKEVPKKGKVFFDAWTKNLAYQKLSVAEKMAMIPEDAPDNPGEDVVDGNLIKSMYPPTNDDLILIKTLPMNAEPKDVSLYLAGDVAVNIIFPESIGGSENWSNPDGQISDRRKKVVQEIMIAMNWWAYNNPQAQLTFHYTNQTIQISREPITEFWWGPWLGETSNALGAGGTGWDAVYNYANSKRDELNTDWSFVIYVVDSLIDEDGAFMDDGTGLKYALVPVIESEWNKGQQVLQIMTYDNRNYGIEDMDQVCAHETGHIFGALDQYYDGYGCESPVDCSLSEGYLDYENQNCYYCSLGEPSIMKWIGPGFVGNYIDEFAKGQIGVTDTNENGISDVLELSNNSLQSHIFNPEFSGVIFDYEGYAYTLVYDSPNEDYNDVGINLIDNVQYTGYLTSQPETKVWNDATGSFGLPSVSYLFNVDTNGMSWGEWTFETRAITRFGDEVYDYDELSIYGCEGGDLDPKVKGNVTNYNGTWNTKYDTCTGFMPFNSYVIQYYCGGYNIESITTRCYYGCDQGRCLNKVIRKPRVYPMEVAVCDNGEICDDGMFYS